MENKDKANKVAVEFETALLRFCNLLKKHGKEVTPEEVKSNLKYMTNFSKFLIYESQNKAIRYDLENQINLHPQSNSGKALLQHERLGKRLSQRERVLEAIQENPAKSREWLSNHTGIKITSLTPRVSELIKSGLVIEANEDISQAGVVVGCLYPAFKR